MPAAADTDPSSADLIELIRWYADMGVDLALDEAPHDRFAEAAAEVRDGARVRSEPQPSASPPSPIGAPAVPPVTEPARAAARFDSVSDRPPVAAPLSTDQAVISARERARSAATLDKLRALLEAFDGCGLKATATRLAFGDGNPDGRIMWVGEAPGADEDRQGVPFVGRAGQLLDRMLAAIGLDRTQVYIANVVPWRPPGNRTPTPQEISVCLPFVRRQIELVDPDILVCLGGAAATTLMGIKGGITTARGRWMDYGLDAPRRGGPRVLPAIATLHPAYLLRQPIHKRFAWRDLREIRRRLDELRPSEAP